MAKSTVCECVLCLCERAPIYRRANNVTLNYCCCAAFAWINNVPSSRSRCSERGQTIGSPLISTHTQHTQHTSHTRNICAILHWLLLLPFANCVCTRTLKATCIRGPHAALHNASTNTHTVNVFYLISIRYDEKLQCSLNRMLVFKFLVLFVLATTTKTERKKGNKIDEMLQCAERRIQMVARLMAAETFIFDTKIKFNNKNAQTNERYKIGRASSERCTPRYRRIWHLRRNKLLRIHQCDLSMRWCGASLLNDGCKFVGKLPKINHSIR